MSWLGNHIGDPDRNTDSVLFLGNTTSSPTPKFCPHLETMVNVTLALHKTECHCELYAVSAGEWELACNKGGSSCTWGDKELDSQS